MAKERKSNAGRVCITCNKYKEPSSFFKDARSKSGLQTKCKECSKAYYQENRERYQELKKQDKHKMKASEYQRNNKDSINKAKRRRYSTEEGKAKVKALAQTRRALKTTSSDGSVTAQFIISLLNKQNYKCAISGQCIKEEYHIDHIKPLSKGGEHKSTNIQLLSPSVNMSKKDRII